MHACYVCRHRIVYIYAVHTHMNACIYVIHVYAYMVKICAKSIRTFCTSITSDTCMSELRTETEPVRGAQDDTSHSAAFVYSVSSYASSA